MSSSSRYTGVLGKFAFFLSVFISSQAFAGSLDQLSAEERGKVVESLLHSKSYVIRTDVEGSLWPQFKVFEKARLNPFESAAVFVDFKNHKNYFNSTGITQSDVVKGEGTQIQEVSYHLNVPLASDDYTCLDHILAEEDGSITVTWDVISSNRVHAVSPRVKVGSHGSARFEAYEGGTLITYTSLISPKKTMGVTLDWVKKRAEGTVVTAAELLAKQIDSESGTPLLQTQTDELTKILKP